MSGKQKGSSSSSRARELKRDNCFHRLIRALRAECILAIDPPSTRDSFEAEARRCQFVTVTEQLVTVSARVKSVRKSQSGPADLPLPPVYTRGLFTRGACLPSKLRVSFHLHGSARDDGGVDAGVASDASHDKQGKVARTLQSMTPEIVRKK